MHKVEVQDRRDLKIYCPFCGTAAVTPDGLNQCEHTLFHASSEGGFEYVSAKLDFTADVDLDELSMDEFLDELEYPNAIRIDVFQPAPSGFCGYVGFALD